MIHAASLAAAACASPVPVYVSEADLAAAGTALADLRGFAAAPDDFRVSGVAVNERSVTLQLTAHTRGAGWATTELASCLRDGDGSDWSCTRLRPQTVAILPGGSRTAVTGLSGEDAARVVRLLRDLGSRLDVDSIRCLAASGPRISVFFGGQTHHAGISYGVAVLEDGGDGLRVESVIPAPSWFEGASAVWTDCDGPHVVPDP